ncbi:MAG: bifunctional glycosyltransferase family 2 protein/CDP-glycerol:glycerophosphate glycerophosphotransferase, partial [Actinomycetota bacterium]|nr:bifunctional glycosyltransferase family 2 protein/CDP-glycerol:glycerophosphate glycerophosphotransferase [Actinomycetota bacterium]
MPESAPFRQRMLGAARKLGTPRVKQAVRRLGGRPLVEYERRGLTPELTVVMAVYNVAEYLSAALDSALTQTLHNLELIAIDDSSTDGCLDILRDYERRDPRVKVFTQPNAGQGVARNVGVKHARGEFLTFLDSDDTVPPGAYRHMVERLRDSGSDFCVGGVRRFKHNEYIRTVWARTVHSRDRIGITMEEFPNAMQDIIACNRMFRTEFWRAKVGDFRGHIAYEDHVPMLTAYVRANRFDILSQVTYNWRIREDKTSTGQQKAKLENLLDRIAVKEQAHELLQAEASELVYDLWVGRALEVDFPPFIVHAIKSGGSYRNILAATYQTFLDRATERALDMVTVRQKIRGQLAAQGRWQDIEAVDTYFDDVGLVPPAHVENGQVVANVPDDDLPFLRGLPEQVRRLSPLECHFEGVLNHVEWEDGAVRLTGWAVRRALSVIGTATFSAWLDDGNGQRIEVPVEGVGQPDANIWGLQQYARYDGGGFVADIDVGSLPARAASWQFGIEVSHDEISSAGSLFNRARWSAGVRDSGAEIDFGDSVGTVRTRWDPGRGFTLVVDPDPVTIESLTITGGIASGVLRVPKRRAPPIAAVQLSNAQRSSVRAATTGPPGNRVRFEVALPTQPAEPQALRTWELAVMAGGREITPLWPASVPEPKLQPAQPTGWVRNATRGASLTVDTPRFEVTGVELGDDTVSLTVQHEGLTEEQLTAAALANPRLSLDRTEVTQEGSTTRFTFSLLAEMITGSRRPAPSGVYDLVVPLPNGPLTASVSPALAGRMPQRDYGRLTNLDVGQTPDGQLRLSLEPPLPPEARGASGRRILRDRYRSAPVTPTNSVLFGCYRGEFATDSQLALDLALAERRPDLTRYWGVADWSTELPEGSVGLLVGSPEWYDTLASSRWLCNNIDFGPFFQQRPHQRYLQTFHGYPFKSMGIGFWRGKGLSEEKVAQAVARANREWDVILVPSEECATYYREQYEYAGEVLASGYPRCDALVNADAGLVRSGVLERLGISPDKTVVLYAPTYRDNLTTRTYAARRFDDLDLARLARALGDGFVI